MSLAPPPTMKMPHGLDGQLQHERLLAEISARFASIPAADVDGAIEEAQRRICGDLGLDRSSLYQLSDEEPEVLLLTHLHQPADGPAWQKRPAPSPLSSSCWVLAETVPPTYVRFDVKTLFPWLYEQIRSGETVVIRDLDDLPAAAAADREAFRRYQTRSTVVVPLSVGGAWLGCLTFATMRDSRRWSEAQVRRFQFIADIFANALARRRANQVLRESEERLQLAMESAGVGLWSWHTETRQAWVTAKTREIFGFGPDEALTDESFYARIHPEDAASVRAAVEQALRAHSDLLADCRVVHSGGAIRWIVARGRPHYRAGGEPECLMGVIVDITERKQVEEELRQRNQYIETVLEQAPIGFAVHTIDDGIGRFVTARYEKIYGAARGSITSVDNFFDQVWPNDPAFREQIRGRMLADITSRDVTRMRWENVPVVLRTGETRFITATNIPLYEQNLMVSTVQDVTERVHAEAELHHAMEELKRMQDQLQQENLCLREEIQGRRSSIPIVGSSDCLMKAIRQAEQVAKTDSTVLVLGETGTGKELLAQYMHAVSRRSARPFVTTNIAAIPATLLESELFGREKGAYTGALTREMGRFELADGGTLFLDEAGEMPMETQVKLLRVLQTGHFERLGSSRPLHVDVRVIAATNRSLADLVKAGLFRQDLFYRLNVFPITLPPLRDRPEDIPLLVWAFVKELSEKMGRTFERFRKKDLEALRGYAWPGNVRELRNVVERSMILSEGPELRLILPDGQAGGDKRFSRRLADVEREHILEVLESVQHRIRGAGGAAEVLGLKPSTLYSLMTRLGITRTG